MNDNAIFIKYVFVCTVYALKGPPSLYSNTLDILYFDTYSLVLHRDALHLLRKSFSSYCLDERTSLTPGLANAFVRTTVHTIWLHR